MTTHVSAEQVRHWIDENAVREVTEHADEETEFNFELQLSRLPIHVIKEEPLGPLRIVGKSAFDTERSRALLRDEADRLALLSRIGPVLAGTPGFYTFLDAEGKACEFRDADTMQTEYRIYPDEASQQALMDGLMDIATGMRYVQNTIAAMLPNPEPTEDGPAQPAAADGSDDGARVDDERDHPAEGDRGTEGVQGTRGAESDGTAESDDEAPSDGQAESDGGADSDGGNESDEESESD